MNSAEWILLLAPQAGAALSHPGKHRHLDHACSQVLSFLGVHVRETSIFPGKCVHVCVSVSVCVCDCADLSPKQLLFSIVRSRLASCDED